MKLTAKQLEAQVLLAGLALYCMLFGGSRSGKTFLKVRNIVMRALKAPGSRHLIVRFRFNHIKSSIIFDTFPKVMQVAFPNVEWHLNKSDWFASIPVKKLDGSVVNSEIWFGGLDDKQRTEKILGNEYVTIYLNECSQISWSSVGMVITRLAQLVYTAIVGKESVPLKPRLYFDCNPPNKLHWTYKLFVKKVDPETNEPLKNADNYVCFKMNPEDNRENLTDGYLDTLDSLSARLRKRFKEGEFADANPNALFDDITIETWREESMPDKVQLIRVVIGVDPSGASDEEENKRNDEIGIVVGGLGSDGNAYLLEDSSIVAGPAIWGKVATSAYDRNAGDLIVGEVNFGGGMVRSTIQVARPQTPFKAVTSSRGKHIRAEPFAALYEKGLVRHVGHFPKLEEELCGFSTVGYTGERSPNRADAWIFVLTELFPAVITAQTEKAKLPAPIPTTNFFKLR